MAYRLFSDEMLAIYVPILVFWIATGIYELIAYRRPDLRLHSKEEEEQKNAPSRWRVAAFAVLLQAAQILLFAVFLKVTGNDKGVPVPQPSVPVLALQSSAAMAILDTQYYFSHRHSHANRFLYNRVHLVHHTVVVPHAAGGLYIHPCAILFDVTATLLSCGLTGMTARTTMYFVSFANVKIADLHSGLWLPRNPLNLLFGNNSAFHDTHHQLRGRRYNFSQPFFVFWDKVMGTYMPFTVEKREGGGFEARMMVKD